MYWPNSFKLGILVESTKLYIFISVWMALTFIQGHICMGNQKLHSPFCRKFKYLFGCSSVCWHDLLLFKSSCYFFFCVLFCFVEGLICKGENSADVKFIKFVLNIVMRQDTCELICFKLGMMFNTTKLKVTGLELVQSFCCKSCLKQLRCS